MSRNPSQDLRLLVSLLLAFLVAVPVVAAPGESADAKKAVRKYQKAVQKSPDDPDNWYNLALAHSLLEEWGAALPAAEKAVELAPEGARARFLLGKVLVGSGRPEAAVTEYEKATELDPGLLEAQAELGDAYYEAGRHEDAVRAYKNALRAKPQNPVSLYNSLGNAYVRLGDVDQATRWFEKTIEAAPADPVSWYNLGAIYKQLARGDDSFKAKAADAFKKAADLDPRDADSQYLAGETAFVADRPDDARKYLGALLKLEPSGQRAELAKVFLAEIS